MQILIGKTAGFCFGVKNAVTKATEELKNKEPIYCLGELVHNRKVTEELQAQGMNFIEKIEDAKNRVIIRAHGVPKEIYEKAQKQNIELIDLTCPKVLKIHKIAEEYKNKGYYIILIGDSEHPEIIGTSSFCGTKYEIIKDKQDIEKAVEKFNNSGINKALIIAQTTFSLEKFREITEEIKERISEEKIEVINTICNATRERQEETERLSKKADAMIIIGSKNSANSNKLNELSKKNCKEVFFIETYEELDTVRIKQIKEIGIMAGASTPQKSIEEVIEKLEQI